MRPRLSILALLALLACSLIPTRALAEPEASRKAALREDAVVFCTHPAHPLSREALGLCPLARTTAGCEALVKACDEAVAPKPRADAGPSFLDRLGPLLGALGKAMLWLFVLGVAIALLVPIVRGLLAWSRRKKDAALTQALVRAAPVRSETTALAPPLRGEARQILERAEQAERAGELDHAISLYLAASLRALDERGHIVLARHRTNGEYVRACKEPELRSSLREITREADAIEFGRRAPDEARTRTTRDHARTVLRALSFLAIALGTLGLGCSPPAPKKVTVNDPAGLEIFRAVAEREGHKVSNLNGSLATLPIPEEGVKTFVLVVDATRVEISDDAASRLVRWVEAGGSLLVAGRPEAWPKAFGAKARASVERNATVYTNDDESSPLVVSLAAPGALTWEVSAMIATTGGELFAARQTRSKGLVVGVARADPFTNLGLGRDGAATAAMAILDEAITAETIEIKIARPEDGVSPPGNPLAALSRAGLSRGLVHGLLLFVLLFFHAGIRHARAKPAAEPERRAFVEHVRATGAFYVRSRAFGHAVRQYARFAHAAAPELPPTLTKKGAIARIRALQDLMRRSTDTHERKKRS